MRKLSVPSTVAAQIPRSVAAFVEFLDATGLLAPGSDPPPQVRAFCEQNTHRFLQAMKDPNHVELLARQELGYVRPGEVSYVIVHPRPSADAPKAKPKTVSWWQRAWGHVRHPW